jgi:hypothetical protein
MSDRALQSFSKRFELEHFADEFIACVKKA